MTNLTNLLQRAALDPTDPGVLDALHRHLDRTRGQLHNLDANTMARLEVLCCAAQRPELHPTPTPPRLTQGGIAIERLLHIPGGHIPIVFSLTPRSEDIDTLRLQVMSGTRTDPEFYLQHGGKPRNMLRSLARARASVDQCIAEIIQETRGERHVHIDSWSEPTPDLPAKINRIAESINFVGKAIAPSPREPDFSPLMRAAGFHVRPPALAQRIDLADQPPRTPPGDDE